MHIIQIEFGSANHAVTIVGWDDNYSKTNFRQDKQPLHDGAYIVLNSWGKEFGDNGYLYVSYDDMFIEEVVCGVDDVEQIEKLDYDEKYEYDELGFNLPIYAVNENKTKYLESGYLANVFTRKDLNKKEYLTEVGLFMATTEGVEIYVNSASDDIKDGKLVASYTGTNALEAGYRTVKLATPIELTGSKFVVKVKYINSEKTSLPLECDITASGISTAKLYNPATSNPGESYISLDGTNWSDIYGYTMDKYTLKDTNACIKAFSIYTGEASTHNDDVKVTGITLNKTNEEIEIGKTTTLTASILPSNATNKNITWKSSDETIAKVQNGAVTGIKEGKATITAITEDGNYKATCEITVKKITQIENTDVKVTGITLNKTKENIEIGKTTTLTASILPSNATNKNITWKSSDETIAKVQNGIVTGIKEGKAIITAITEDGNYKATCEITVKKPIQIENVDVKVTGIALNKSSEKIQVGETFNLVATVYPANATNKQVKWMSSDEAIATVSETGIIKTIKEGTCTITVTSLDGSFSASCVLTVTAKTNNDDDIYKEQEQEEEEENENENIQIPAEEDKTKSSKILPYTGLRTIIIFTVLIGAIVVINYIKYKKLKDVI